MGTNNVSQGQPPAYSTATAEGAKATMKSMLEAAELDAKLDAMLGIGTFMTAEEMYLFAEAKLRSTDAELSAHMKDITLKKEMGAAMQEISAGIRSVKNSTGPEQKAKFEELIEKANKAGLTDVADLLTKGLGKIEANIKSYGDPSTSDFIESVALDVDAKVTALTSSTELTMIRIQGLMQHRSQVLQLASNVIAALNEPAKNAIGNIRGS
ncbi:MAG: hypothetical protein IPM35_26055 [Myxococcales bacterium]|nr:hypothetical protein [Myxococcales bacterium]